MTGAGTNDSRFDPSAMTIGAGIASMNVFLPREGELCQPEGYEFERHVTMTATPESFLLVAVTPNHDYSCEPDHTTTSVGSTDTWRGTFAGGDTCIFAGIATCQEAVHDAGADGQADNPAAVGVGADVTLQERFVGLIGASPAAPSVLSTLPVADAVRVDAGHLALTAIVVVILVLLLAFPTQLLNRATEEGFERWQRRHHGGVAAPKAGRTVKTFAAAAGGLLTAALISSFVDPGFGFTAASARVFGSIAFSFVLELGVGWFILIAVMRRLAPSAPPSVEFKPASLLIVIAAVIFTRITEFQPALLFGLVAGVAFATASTHLKIRTTLISTCYTMGVGLIAWVAYSLISGGVEPGKNVGSQFALETLASLTIGAFAGLPLALVPLRGLSGHGIFMWNRWVWGGLYGFALLVFFIVLLPLPSSWAGIDLDLTVWIGLYLMYAVIAVAAWLFLRPLPDVLATAEVNSDSDREHSENRAG
ncbi:hypothetical protein [Cryobacterium serini]|uniref:Uncharacterized protein n=1 Tax=Cryobacterium serini TaxID=1259201 RepID=A0A4R9BN30_9MICO|nr:hypothetical protein [Cryobacterium serini]TFD87853.1 hypothetical protein E3T51_10360 [Cryobacterium serini]